MERVKNYSCFLLALVIGLFQGEFIDFPSLDFVTYREGGGILF